MIVYDKQTGTTALSLVFPYQVLFEKVRAKIALFSHNLAPDPNACVDELSWDEGRDEALLKFTHLCALERVAGRLAARSAKLIVSESSVSLVLRPADADEGLERLESLLHAQISDVLLNSMLADKLLFSCRELRPVVRAMREEFLQRAEQSLDDIVCSMAIFQPVA